MEEEEARNETAVGSGGGVDEGCLCGSPPAEGKGGDTTTVDGGAQGGIMAGTEAPVGVGAASCQCVSPIPIIASSTSRQSQDISSWFSFSIDSNA